MIATPKFSETLQEIYVIHLKAKNVEEYTTLRHSFITNIYIIQVHCPNIIQTISTK
jgi:hypothetical protein